MNSNANKEFRNVLSTIHLSNKIFRVYAEKLDKGALQEKMIDVIKMIEKHQIKLVEIFKKSGKAISDRLNLIQEMIINKEIMNKNNDEYRIVCEGLKTLNRNTLTCIEFLRYQDKEFVEINNYLKRIIKDYDDLSDRLRKYIVEKYC